MEQLNLVIEVKGEKPLQMIRPFTVADLGREPVTLSVQTKEQTIIQIRVEVAPTES